VSAWGAPIREWSDSAMGAQDSSAFTRLVTHVIIPVVGTSREWGQVEALAG